ncbi:MAG: GGDEF domain-containing protein [Burkholderiales bacterium]
MQPLNATQPLPPPPEAEVRAGLLLEMFARTREGSPLGMLAIGLIAFSHLDVVEPSRIALWVCVILAAGVLHWRLALAFLRRPRGEHSDQSRWVRREVAATLAVSLAWPSSIWLLDTGAMDGLLYFNLVVLLTVAAVMLGTLGMLPRVYGSFLVGFVATLAAFFATRPPHESSQALLLLVGVLMFGAVMMMRSRVEHRLARRWVEARLMQDTLVDRLRELASRDPLTGAFSRGFIQQALRTLGAAQKRQAAPYSVLLLDVDHFKDVNDRCGHACGDEVLRKITAAVLAELRPSDQCGRWGGEEFIVLLPQTTLDAAAEAANRLRRRVKRLDLASLAAGLKVTVSIGVAEAEPAETAEATIGRADTALYAAKRAGRNRVAIASAAEPAGGQQSAGEAA